MLRFVGYNLTEKSCISSIPTVAKESRLTMRGRLLGGCMDCLINLLGTSFDHVREFNERYSDDGIIWFLEACDLNVMGMRRAMWQMKNAGWFSNVKGFLIGRPAHFGEEMFGIDHRQALSSLLREFNVPINRRQYYSYYPYSMMIGTLNSLSSDESACLWSMPNISSPKCVGFPIRKPFTFENHPAFLSAT